VVSGQYFLAINRAAISTIGQCLFPVSTDEATRLGMRALSRIVRTQALRQSRPKFSRVTRDLGFHLLIKRNRHNTPSSSFTSVNARFILRK
jgi:hypothetical protein